MVDPHTMHMMMGMMGFFFIFFLIGVVIMLIPFWFIWKKAGFSPWLSLLSRLPRGLPR
jgi:asparagine N-glycosylation enzyme membrane subunit Stt3